MVRHEELGSLSIAHIDCETFYATVEKRDRLELADRSVIIASGARGVVLVCCYVVRLYGVRSAMPMFKALAACPDAVVITTEHVEVSGVGRVIRAEQASLATGTITLKLKIADFHLRTRSRRVSDPTQLADTLFHTASALRVSEADGVTRFRLIGVGADHLFDSRVAGPPGLFDREINRPRRLEQAIGEIRGRLSESSIRFGRNPLAERSQTAQPSPLRTDGVTAEPPVGQEQSRRTDLPSRAPRWLEG